MGTTSNFSSDCKTSNQDIQLKKNAYTCQISNHIKRLTLNNQKYFNHLAGNCKCGKCKCQRCKCIVKGIQIDYKPDIISVYEQDFQQKPIETQYTFYLDNDPYKQDAKMDIQSVNRLDFIPKQAKDPIQEIPQVNRQTLFVDYLPINQKTSYNSNFKGQNFYPQNVTYTPLDNLHQPLQLKYPKFHTSNYNYGNLSFRQEQKNNFKYINFAQERDRKMKPPIGLEIPLMGETTYQRCHSVNRQREKTDNSSIIENTEQLINKRKNQHFYQPIPTFEGQYRSIKENDYQQTEISTCDQQNIKPDDINRLSRRAYMYRVYQETN